MEAEDRMVTEKKSRRGRKPGQTYKRRLTPPGDDYVPAVRDHDLPSRVAQRGEMVEHVSEAAEPPAQRSRKAEERQQRRRRDTDGMDGARMRLAIPEKYRQDPDYEYRWINDDKARVYDLTVMDDWDVVKAGDIDNHHGANSVRRQVGAKADGSALFAQLVRKPRDFCETDRAKSQARLDETMDAVTAKRKRGDPAALQGGQGGYVATDTTYRDGRLDK